jgi:MarR family transcriptional regulator, transcriptional regulator for hemolysin
MMCFSRLGPRCREAAGRRDPFNYGAYYSTGVGRTQQKCYLHVLFDRAFIRGRTSLPVPTPIRALDAMAPTSDSARGKQVDQPGRFAQPLTRMKPSRKTPRRTSATERATQPLAGPAPSASTRAALDAQSRSSTADLLAATGETVEGEIQQNRRLPILLRRAWYGLNQAFRRRIAHTGLTPDQFTVLRNLTEGDSRGMTQSQLTDLMSSDPNTIAALIDRMEIAGHVERRPHERDRRSHRIRLRPKGRSRYRQLVAIAAGLQNDVLAVLPAHRRAAFLRELTCVADGCRTMAEDERRRPETG